MRVYQTIHKYPPHIPLFEERNGVRDGSDITFAQLQQLIIEDGYAASYILEPALQGKTDEVFFTIWNYERLQFLWAKEHSIDSKDLSVIKKAQIDWFKPDVFYNHSAFCDDDFVSKYPLSEEILKVCWYGIVLTEALLLPGYDIRISLHRPFIDQWHKAGLSACEMQPSFYDGWSSFDSNNKDIDLLFYGQTGPSFFKKRNRMLDRILALTNDFNIRVHLSFPKIRKIFSVPIISDYFRYGFSPKKLNQYALPPIYGEALYASIGKSKFTLNGYGNFNQFYKSNMRLFEALGCGSLLISEDGNYPDGFVEGKHYIGYKDSDDLLQKLPDILANYESLKLQMQPHIKDLIKRYSKENQWDTFQHVIADFKSKSVKTK